MTFPYLSGIGREWQFRNALFSAQTKGVDLTDTFSSRDS